MAQNVLPVKGAVAALSNVGLAATSMERLINAPSHLPRIGVFYGRAGLGKTSAACYLMNRFNAYRIECKSVWTKRTIFLEILKLMGIPAKATMPEMLDQVCTQLQLSRRPLIVDEVDHVVKKQAIEVIRDIYDGSQCALMLIGEENLPTQLERWERVHRRVLDWTPAQPLDLDDAEVLADFYSQRVTVAHDLLAHIHSVSDGSAGRICVNLELVQEEALRQGLDSIDLAAWGNHPLYMGAAPARDRRFR